MGRKPINKTRLDNPDKKMEWAKALMPVFHQKGLKTFTMDDISSILNISKATVYKYFKTREEIVEMAVEANLEQIRKFECELENPTGTYIENYKRAVKRLTTNISDVSSIFLKDLKKMYPDIWENIINLQDYSISVLENYYKEGMEKGLIRNVNPAILALSDRLFFSSLVDPKFLERNHMTINDAFDSYFEMKLNGILK